jgi:glutamate N-acetyltransferase/amino-acid N-acetyltransferase
MFKIIPIKGGLCAPHGFFSHGCSAGLKKENANDVAFIYSDALCNVDAIFTTNNFAAAPIRHFQKYGKFQTNFVLMNAKNANAMTGSKGIEDINDLLGELKNTHPSIVNPIMSSTGVIGVPLPKEKLAATFSSFDLSRQDSQSSSHAIMTTDSFPKEISFEVILEDEKRFRIGAIAKGAGMIDPAMATMLCFITTDAAVPDHHIKPLLQECVHTTFNAISVDGDTSTNDSVIVLANGKSGVYDSSAFKEALRLVMHEMALLMVKDGEGAKKLVAFKVVGARDDKQAEIAAKALSNSSLVKTALFGEDPNWGRIASTIGSSGVECYEEKLTIMFESVVVYEKGTIHFSPENEEKAAKVMQKDEFKIICDLGCANGSFTAYGCDLGYDYVKINADYRT